MDKMKLTKNDGTIEEIEIVTTFKIDKYNNDYIIYKSNNKYYAARYYEKNNNIDLDTNLTKEEKQSLEEVFDKLHKGGIIC